MSNERYNILLNATAITYFICSILMFYDDGTEARNYNWFQSLHDAQLYLWDKQHHVHFLFSVVCPTNTFSRWASSAVGVAVLPYHYPCET